MIQTLFSPASGGILLDIVSFFILYCNSNNRIQASVPVIEVALLQSKNLSQISTNEVDERLLDTVCSLPYLF